ncbi:acyltransferase family protein [Limnoglobus roseus]|uniref:Acyltransferase n=1 Tax=Limnoglobus roseus TaxID=2598579 RepID=A0A5C1ADE8_9BACT|nr:acyltransferase [Limnoglobus roseus]QEL16026.1 acyltransferase [Limnoglobus roseus]
MRLRFESVQILRGLACLLVVAYHVASQEVGFGLKFSYLRPLPWFGYAGVDLFFVLSGFIITTTSAASWGRPAALPGYLVRRWWRIFPMYYVALVVAGLVFVVCVPEPLVKGGADELLDTLLLYPQVPSPRILPVAWTLSYEVFFYAAIGVLFLVPKRVGPWLLVAWAAVVVGCAIFDPHPTHRLRIVAGEPFVLEFLAGCAVALCPVKLGPRQATIVAGAAVVWAGTGLWLTYDPDVTRLSTTAPARVAVFGVASALLVLAATGWERAGGRLVWPRLARVGDASYSIYLLHVPMLTAATHLSLAAGMSHSQLGHGVWIALMFLATIAPGLVLHRFVEAPLQKMGKRPRVPDAGSPGSQIEGSRLAA